MNIYHVLNRGVEKRSIVVDDSDRLRFVHSLFVFNDARPLDDNHRAKDFLLAAADRELLVHIHAWCLMDNHYHLLLSPVHDDLNNLSLFMKKLNMGYARYFNERYNRSGYLWQGKYKKVLIEQDAHFMYIPYYIHLNPLDFTMKEWRSGGVQDSTSAIEKLAQYRWSSYLDYSGQKNFPSIVTSKLLRSVLGDAAQQEKEITNLISGLQPLAAAQSIE